MSFWQERMPAAQIERVIFANTSNKGLQGLAHCLPASSPRDGGSVADMPGSNGNIAKSRRIAIAVL
jgi:hypothetical protein